MTTSPSSAALQGGTCVILGDDYKLMGETAKIAKQKLGCQVFRRPPYFRKAGHVQVEFNKEPLAKRCAYTVQYLQEIEMMTHADYFVGAQRSSGSCSACRHPSCTGTGHSCWLVHRSWPSQNNI